MASASARLDCCHSVAGDLYAAALHGDMAAAGALADLYHESELTMRPGDAVYVTGPLDMTIGVVESLDGGWLRMRPGCVTSREVTSETALIATGVPPAGTTYTVHPRGRVVALLSVTGYSPLPQFDPADWPPRP